MAIVDRSPLAVRTVNAGVATSNPQRLLPTRKLFENEESSVDLADPIQPWLRKIKKVSDDLMRNANAESLKHFKNLLEECIKKIGGNDLYKEDTRLLKIWILYGDVTGETEKAYTFLDERGQFGKEALLYEAYASFLVKKRNLEEADRIFRLGISRNAEPLDRLLEMHKRFCEKFSHTFVKPEPNLEADVQICSEQPSSIDPWSNSTMTNLLEKINPRMKKYEARFLACGFHRSNKLYDGKISLASQNNSRNKIVELVGNRKYQIKGCAGSGGFALVFKAFVDGNPEEVVALKVQNPAFPWEFYMYRQLDLRIAGNERLNFGYAHRIHLYSDLSVVVCDYLSHGTLQDAINSHIVSNHHMDEVLCMYYTIQMLYMLETLHGVGLIHGDFKPNNLLVRYPSLYLCFQGLCLIDWGRGIDVNLFPDGTVFHGDCRTSGFRCVQMQEKHKWKFQVDTYGLCVIVHMMLHGSYMNIEKKVNVDGSYHFQPKSTLRRYWRVELWKNLFQTLLNFHSNKVSDVPVLKSLRGAFEEYLCGNRQLVTRLIQLLAKQRASLCSA
ncbi:mitotic checkpoint serine/threonine-protein kinase BUB1 [Carex littledalei]|uniref:Mitotic checkpoint serine/threonine-protein kinase BUB1 n=1 Tax=Carex littledalei TaxID=544730 RepID=A0A833QUI4_9POAL|nr:mitotic checkpoint serine/threonine-protein kinase BUB1 [Carex littledalei]